MHSLEANAKIRFILLGISGERALRGAQKIRKVAKDASFNPGLLHKKRLQFRVQIPEEFRGVNCNLQFGACSSTRNGAKTQTFAVSFLRKSSKRASRARNLLVEIILQQDVPEVYYDESRKNTLVTS